jgi:polyvinyl alcohol dehydrogenase (cytochrome)
VGVASNEESAAADPNYPCCSTRGSLLLLEAQTGEVQWQTYTVTDTERAAGASGSSIWSTPAYDAKTNVIYATTGNNFSQPTNGTSDAFIAFSASSGKIKWINQRFPNDEWNFRFPFSPEHPDADFGDSPQIYSLPDGRRVVGAGQKSGFYHVLDAKSGALLFQTQYEPGGTLGGLFADTAVANGTVYINGVNWPNPGGGPLGTSDVFATSGDGTQTIWRFPVPTPEMAGVAVANSVVYFTSTWAGRLFALDAATGAMLAAPAVGISDSGPSISNGRVFVGTGDPTSLAFGIVQSATGSIAALGL